MAANRSSEGATTGSRRAQVTRLLSEIEKKLKGKESATMSDYIRLLQLERELEDDEPPREIIVTWVDSTGTQDGEE
jgi:hypothetical protein